ncbi:MAG: ATP-binding cassette domain-containing protein, partial [Methanomicrobium sp.]|nr:ATP-binding cassette domain-containing protein [Methanomicrobium sp.]
MNDQNPTRSNQVELSGVYTAYMGAQYPVIKNLNFSIEKGEFVVVGGPNGAGKTTLLETINGMLPITYGSAKAFGLDVTQKGPEIRKKIGYVIQSFAFDPLTPFTVENVVMMGRYGLIGLFKKPEEADFKAAETSIKMLGLEDMCDKPIGTLSGGQQQKVLIAQNLAKKPEILLLDEPFSNLDLCTREFTSGVLEDISSKG